MRKFPPLLFMLKRHHLTEEQQEVFDCVGAEGYAKLVEKFGGSVIRIPQDKSINLLVSDYIMRFYTVINKKELAEHLRISTRYLQKILLKSYSIIKQKPTLGKIP